MLQVETDWEVRGGGGDPITHFSDEYTENSPLGPDLLSCLRSLFHSCSFLLYTFHKFCFCVSYPFPPSIPSSLFSFRTPTALRTDSDLLKCISSYFIKSLKALEDYNAHTFNTEMSWSTCLGHSILEICLRIRLLQDTAILPRNFALDIKNNYLCFIGLLYEFIEMN